MATDIVVNGTVIDGENNVAANISVRWTPLSVSGAAVWSAVRYGVTNASGEIKAKNGIDDLILIAGATYLVQAPVLGFDGDGSTVTLPSSGPVDFSTLVADAAYVAAGLTLKEDGNVLSGYYSTLNFIGATVERASAGVANITVQGGGAVSSVFGRTGAVIAASNDYTWAQIDKTTSSLANLTTRLYSDLQGIPSTFAPSAHNQAWSTITSTPTTLSGYGITDAAAIGHNHSGVYQPASANLTTYAGIAPSANVQTLLGAADYGAFRSSLGLATSDAPAFAGLNLTDNAIISDSKYIQLGASGETRLMESDDLIGSGFIWLTGDTEGDKGIATPGTLKFFANTGLDGLGTFRPSLEMGSSFHVLAGEITFDFTSGTTEFVKNDTQVFVVTTVADQPFTAFGALNTNFPGLLRSGTELQQVLGDGSAGGSFYVTGILRAGSGPTTLTDSTGKILSAALNTIAIANGGTGQTTAGNAINALLPSQSGHSGEFLTTNGSAASWAAGGGSPGGSNTQLQYNNSSVFGGISGATSDGTNVTYGSGNLRATSPRITTDLSDSNGNELFKVTATGSAVNEFTVANAATGGSPTLSATGGDSNIGITLTPKGTGNILLSSGMLQFGGTSSSFPSLKRSTIVNTDLWVITSDGSAFAGIGGDKISGFNYSTGNYIVQMVGGTDGNGVTLRWAPGDGNLTDLGLERNAMGVLAVNSGTKNTYRDILARGLRSNPVTFANAISSPVEGTLQAFTDSTTATWGATITGGGSNHVLAYFNGSNWTVAGK